MNHKGFTLVEILIVVVILAILAAIVLPQMSNASATAKASMLADDLRVMRTQILVFKSQHNGIAPGYPGCDFSQAPTESAFVSAITMASKVDGETAAPGTTGYNYGPYMREVPPNPVNGKSTVLIIADNAAFPTVADNSYGWIYQPSTLTFRADSTGADDVGKSYFSY